MVRARTPGSAGELRFAHQIPVAFASRLPAFVDGPDDKTLTASAVARSEHPFDVGGIFAVLGFEVTADIGLDAEFFCDELLGAGEAECQEAEQEEGGCTPATHAVRAVRVSGGVQPDLEGLPTGLAMP